jgi:cytochrome c peroxidase
MRIAIACVLGATLIILGCSLIVQGKGDSGLAPVEQLGKSLFFDKISHPDSMSCSGCHSPDVGWTGPIPGINLSGAVYRGAVPTRFGNRKPPSAAYATFSPILHYDETEELFIGGNFWDGRATGEHLGNPAADQALGPFLNPVEQNNPSKQAVCEQVAASKYAGLFEEAWGQGSLDCSDAGIEATYDFIGLSIAAYEASPEVNQFSSKYDAFLAGIDTLTDQEAEGLDLFEGKAMCAGCHPSEAGPYAYQPLFTDYTFDNLGVPRNPENPFYTQTEFNPAGFSWVDLGLGGYLESIGNPAANDNMGKQKVPTLRNVDKRYGESFPKAYTHNGYFKSLKSIVHFYNTRDVKPVCPDPFTTEKEALASGCWPEPEVPDNVNRDELGNLGLTDEEEDALVAFLKTLSDEYKVKKKVK